MRVGGFEVKEPVLEPNEPCVIATLRPWIDVNKVGSLVLKELKTRFDATEFAKLSRPGTFYDFTRYRPTILIKEEGIRDMSIPNTTVQYAQRDEKNDLLLLRMLEPHAHAELYVKSVVKLLKTFRAEKYILVGSMYDAVPHTRPLLLSGYGINGNAAEDVRKTGARSIIYQGPTTIANLITKEIAESGIEACVLIVSLPQYVVLEEDYMGKARLMEALSMLCDIPVDRDDFAKALEQRNLISERIDSSPEVKLLLPQLERAYDMRVKSMEPQANSPLSPEMEDILWKIMEKDIGKA